MGNKGVLKQRAPLGATAALLNVACHPGVGDVVVQG